MRRPHAFLLALLLASWATPAWAGANEDLIMGAFNGSPPVVNRALAAGADVNARDESGYTPLMWAAQRGHTLTAQVLLRKGASVHVTDKQGHSVLLVAVVKGQREMVRLLMAHGADPNARSGEGTTPLAYAQAYRRTALIQLLTKPQAARATPTPHVAAHPTPAPRATATPHAMAHPTAAPTPHAVAHATPAPHGTAAPHHPPAGELALNAANRTALTQAHQRFLSHLAKRDPEALVQAGHNQALQDQLDQLFLTLSYGNATSLTAAKRAEVAAALAAAEATAALPDPQDDKESRAILASVTQSLKAAGL